MVQRLLTWPAALPSSLEGVGDQVAEQLGVAEVVGLTELGELSGARGTQRTGDRDGLLLVVDAALTSGHDAGSVVAALAELRDQSELDIVAIVGDGYLGTDHDDVGAAIAGAAAVSTMRSIATRRDATGRANVVAVPDAMFGRAEVHRGALRQEVEMIDVANAAAFLLSEQGGYLNGQVVFVDGGRHVFSSMSA